MQKLAAEKANADAKVKVEAMKKAKA